MGEARVKWIEKRQFVGIDSSKHSVVMSSQDEDNGAGMKPSDLLLVALGGCTACDVVQDAIELSEELFRRRDGARRGRDRLGDFTSFLRCPHQIFTQIAHNPDRIARYLLNK